MQNLLAQSAKTLSQVGHWTIGLPVDVLGYMLEDVPEDVLENVLEDMLEDVIVEL